MSGEYCHKVSKRQLGYCSNSARERRIGKLVHAKVQEIQLVRRIGELVHAKALKSIRSLFSLTVFLMRLQDTCRCRRITRNSRNLYSNSLQYIENSSNTVKVHIHEFPIIQSQQEDRQT